MKIENKKDIVVNVVDAPPGSGKTTRAIQYMCDNNNLKFLFVTPFLDQVNRVKDECLKLNVEFHEPVSGARKRVNEFGKVETYYVSKSEHFNELVKEGKSIVTTHSLFFDLKSSTIDEINEMNYHLFLDEVSDDIIKQVATINKQDIKMLISRGYIKIDEDGDILPEQGLDEDGLYYQTEDGQKNYIKLLETLETSGVFLFENRACIFLLPIKFLESLVSITILTYLIEGQNIYSYLKLFNTQINKLTCNRDSNGFIPWYQQSIAEYANLITLADTPTLNNETQKETDYSLSFWEKKQEKSYLIEKKAITNFTKRFKLKSSDVIWTVYKGENEITKHVEIKLTKEEKKLSIEKQCEIMLATEQINSVEKIGKIQSKLMGIGFDKSFLQCKSRSTNNYSDRTAVIYLCNIYHQPILYNFLLSKGIECNEDLYALSIMLQFIFRSAVREKKPIQLYIRSKRMRRLLKMWMDEKNINNIVNQDNSIK